MAELFLSYKFNSSFCHFTSHAQNTLRLQNNNNRKLLQIWLVRNNVLGFTFLTPCEGYSDKLDGYSTSWLQRSCGILCYDRAGPRKQNRGRKVEVETRILLIHTQTTHHDPSLCLKSQGAALTTRRALPCPSPLPGDKTPHLQGLPSSNTAADPLCLISGTAL